MDAVVYKSRVIKEAIVEAIMQHSKAKKTTVKQKHDTKADPANPISLPSREIGTLHQTIGGIPCFVSPN